MTVYLTRYELDNLLRRSKYYHPKRKFIQSNTKYEFIYSSKSMALIYYQFFLPEQKENIEVSKRCRSNLGIKGHKGAARSPPPS